MDVECPESSTKRRKRRSSACQSGKNKRVNRMRAPNQPEIAEIPELVGKSNLEIREDELLYRRLCVFRTWKRQEKFKFTKNEKRAEIEIKTQQIESSAGL